MTKKMMEEAMAVEYDNFPIKVYAFDPQGGVFTRLANGAKRLSVCVGEQGTAQLELYGPKSEGKTMADYANSELATNEWVVESASEGLVEITPSADGTSAQIKGLKPGTAYVVAHIWGLGRVIIPVDVHEHKWGQPTYTWADDNSTCTAVRTCDFDASHMETETVAVAASGTTLTATFANPAFEKQDKTVEAPAEEPRDPKQDEGQAAPGAKSTTEPTSTATKAAQLPKTGDGTAPAAAVALLIAGTCLLLASLAVLRRRDTL